MSDSTKPWVLVRKGKPPMRFASIEEGKRFYDRLRFNATQDSDATLFGPRGLEWRCGRFSASSWAEIFGDRRSGRTEAERVE